MGEDPADHPRILKGRDETHAAATARTREHVKFEGAPHQVSPGPVAGFGRTEEQVAGAIMPLALELQQDAPLAGEPETVLGDRRSTIMDKQDKSGSAE